MRLALCVAAIVGGTLAAVAAQQRPVIWLTADGERLERTLNQQASRGLRVAAVLDGLPCSALAVQVPVTPNATPVEYAVVPARALGQRVAALGEGGFRPVAALKDRLRAPDVVFARSPGASPVALRLVEFTKVDELAAALAPVAADGFRPMVLAREPLRSWPGLSASGLLIAVREGPSPREARVVIAGRKDVDDFAATVAALAKDGWTADVAWSSTRDGSPAGRRERAAVVFSRVVGAPGAPTSLRVTRTTSWNPGGDGRLAFAVPFWDEYLFGVVDVPRLKLWGRPVRLDPENDGCVGVEYALAGDGVDGNRDDVVGAIARPTPGGGREIVVLTLNRLPGAK